MARATKETVSTILAVDKSSSSNSNSNSNSNNTARVNLNLLSMVAKRNAKV